MTVNAGMNAAGPGFDGFETPRGLFNALDAIFHFTVDAAATPANALMGRFWTEQFSGLMAEWDGERVFCNPPYSDIEPWTRKAVSRAASVAVLLLPSFTGTDWFVRDVAGGGAEVWALRRRVKFTIDGRPPLNQRTGKPSGPRFASLVCIWHRADEPGRTARLRSWDWQ